MSNIEYGFKCNTTTENNLYKIYCVPNHGMGMLKVPEEATNQCLGELNIETTDKVKPNKFKSAL